MQGKDGLKIRDFRQMGLEIADRVPILKTGWLFRVWAEI
jgi:hypothetical protein